MTLKDKPAYPSFEHDGTFHPGMTLFEYLVAKAMQGYIIAGKLGMMDISEAAILQAKSQIEALEKYYQTEQSAKEEKK